jgi:hypothetical protein
MAYQYKTVGTKYEATKDLDIAEVAKLVRKDLKEAYPRYKFSVRIDRFSMGQSLDVVVSNSGLSRHSDAANGLERKVKEIVDAYNFDDSDSMTDYFHVAFYSGVRVES